MVVFEIAFVLLNLSIPYFLWIRSSSSHLPEVDRAALLKTTYQLVNLAGGFPPCSPEDVANSLEDLCEKSRQSWKKDQPEAHEERTGVNVTFACEVGATNVKLSWVSGKNAEPALNCEPGRQDRMAFQPAFNLNLVGQLRSAEFTATDGQRNKVRFADCRSKLKVAAQMQKLPAQESEFLRALGRLPTDPENYILGNKMCLMFDPAPKWSPLRQRYDQQLNLDQ